MKRFLLILCAAAGLWACSQPAAGPAGKARFVCAELRNPSSPYVVVVSHRGDWRNWPENSIPAIESVIGMGADIMELDLKLTKDSVLVLCHDKTIDRTTNGHGRVCDITYDSLRRCVLKTGHGYEYYDLALAVTEELGVTDQVLIKGKRPVEIVAAKFAQHPHNMMYMPIIDILKPQGRELFEEYASKGIVPLAYEVCWNEYTPDVEACMRQVVAGGSKLWVNSLWDSLCGGLSDDKAFAGSPDQVYGPLLDMGASIIQTDRPDLLIRYLESQGRR